MSCPYPQNLLLSYPDIRSEYQLQQDRWPGPYEQRPLTAAFIPGESPPLVKNSDSFDRFQWYKMLCLQFCILSRCFQAGYRSDNSTIVEISLKNAEKTVHGGL